MTYEFTESENVVFERVSMRLITQAILLYVGGLVNLVIAIFTVGDVAGWVTALIIFESFMELAIGTVFIRPSDNLRNIAHTSGNDISELMTGLKELNVAFSSTTIMIIAIALSESIKLMGGS